MKQNKKYIKVSGGGRLPFICERNKLKILNFIYGNERNTPCERSYADL